MVKHRILEICNINNANVSWNYASYLELCICLLDKPQRCIFLSQIIKYWSFIWIFYRYRILSQNSLNPRWGLTFCWAKSRIPTVLHISRAICKPHCWRAVRHIQLVYRLWLQFCVDCSKLQQIGTFIIMAVQPARISSWPENSIYSVNFIDPCNCLGGNMAVHTSQGISIVAPDQDLY